MDDDKLVGEEKELLLGDDLLSDDASVGVDEDEDEESAPEEERL